MDEKTMVNDILSGIKSELTVYQTAISETENMNLRQTIQQMRNSDESFSNKRLLPTCSTCYCYRNSSSKKSITIIFIDFKNALKYTYNLSAFLLFILHMFI